MKTIKSRGIPLAFIGANSILEFYKFHLRTKNTETGAIHEMVRIPHSFKEGLLSLSNTIAKIARLTPRSFCRVNENIYFILAGRLYRFNITTKSLYEIANHVTNPFSITEYHGSREDIEIIFGDYSLNPSREQVNIWGASKDKITKICSFRKKEIRHVHNIIPTNDDDVFLALTGDDDNECGIWEVNIKTGMINAKFFGEQKYRSCAGWYSDDTLMVIGDSPFERNYLRFISLKTGEIRNGPILDAPVIYSLQIPEKGLLFSLSAEPNKLNNGTSHPKIPIDGIHGGVLSKWSKTYVFNCNDSSLNEIAQGEKMAMPYKFGYGTYMFASGARDWYIIIPKFLKRQNNRYYVFSKDELFRKQQ